MLYEEREGGATMPSRTNDVSCQGLQRWMEAAWDEGDEQRLMLLSETVDKLTMEKIRQAMAAQAGP